MILQKIYNFLTSAKLAMALLVTILVCCIVGVTIFRGERAWSLIFSTLWFNSLLVLLVVNVAFCFFGRIWGRKVALISFGMILFHLSFVFMLMGVIYNGLFYFRGNIRLTEGETLPNGDLQSYDQSDRGRFFNLSRLKGETSLIKMHADYKVDGVNKRAAYEISVGEGRLKKQEIIYITKHLEYKGFKYFNDREGYSVLAVLFDRKGKELYGAHIPLQSLSQKDDSYLYTTGTKEGPAGLIFPQPPLKPLFGLQVTYYPSKLKERGGEAFFQVWPLDKAETGDAAKPLAEGKAAVGEKFHGGEYQLAVQEIRYWVGMRVVYEPGQPIVLASMWAGLAGMIITFYGRMRRKKK
ncbi:MAG: cytochrome c biogenesis protein ResB [Thermodesulfovibrionales bacterium]